MTGYDYVWNFFVVSANASSTCDGLEAYVWSALVSVSSRQWYDDITAPNSRNAFYAFKTSNRNATFD